MLLLAILLVPSAQAQYLEETPREVFLLGISGGAVFSWHQGSFTTSDARYDCCTFSGGNGIGRAVGLRGVIPLNGMIFLRPGIAFDQLNADYPEKLDSYPVLASDNSVTLMTLEEALQISLETFSAELLLAYRIVDPGMYVIAGPAYTVLMSRHQTQTERIVSPADLEFIDGGRSHDLIDSEIEGLSSFLSLRLGAGVLFPISPMFHANPEASFILPLTDVEQEGAWSVAGFTFSLGILLML